MELGDLIDKNKKPKHKSVLPPKKGLVKQMILAGIAKNIRTAAGFGNKQLKGSKAARSTIPTPDDIVGPREGFGNKHLKGSEAAPSTIPTPDDTVGPRDDFGNKHLKGSNPSPSTTPTPDNILDPKEGLLASSIKSSRSDTGKVISDSVLVIPQQKDGRLGDEGSEGTALTRNEQLSKRQDEKIVDQSEEPQVSLDSSSQLPNLTQVLCYLEPNKLEFLPIQSLDDDSTQSIWSSDADYENSEWSSDEDWTKLSHSQMPSEPTDVLFHVFIQELIRDGILFGISFPCNRIPNWFSYGSSKSSISIKLSPEDNHSSLEGIALYVVFVIKEDENFDKDGELKRIYCHFHFNECLFEYPLIFEGFRQFELGSFGIFCYIPQEWFSGQLTNTNTMIHTSISTKSLNVELKMLGILPIYRQDVEELAKNLAQTANEHREVALDLSRHCKQLLDGSTKLKIFEDVMTSVWYDSSKEISTSTQPPQEAEQDGSGSTTQLMRSEIQLLLSRLFQGRHAQKNRFYFTVPLRFFSNWFFHQSIGDTTICYLPPNLYNEEGWLGLELYVLFKRRPTILRSTLDSDQIPSLLLVDLYAHGDTTSPILTYPLLIDDAFFGSHFVFSHVPRECFLQKLNQYQGISALFRPSSSDLEVEMCGTRLLFERDSESLIKVIIDSAQGRTEVLDLLCLQIDRAKTRQLDKIEQEVSHLGLVPSFERERIEWLQNLLTSTEQVAEEVRTLFYNHRLCVAHNKEFDSVFVHSKHWFLDNQDPIHKISGGTSDFNHLHIMAESLIDLGSNLLYRKEYIDLLLKEFFKNFVVTLSFKGDIVFDLKHFDTFSMYNLCFPRREILEVFKHPRPGSKLGIKLPPGLCNDKNWSGLAICAALSIDQDNKNQIRASEMPFTILCHLKTSEFCLNPVPMYSITEEKLNWLDHGLVWLTYIPRYLLFELNEQSYVAARIYSDFPGLMVKTCGIRLLYQQDVEEFKQKIIHCWTSFIGNLDSAYQFVLNKDSDNEESS